MKFSGLKFGVAAIVLAFGATACGGSGTGNGTGDSSTKPGETVSLDWGFWNQGDEGNKMWQGLADQVTEQDPTIKVSLTSPPFADYFTKLQSQLASNSAPCIVSMQSLRLPAFADAMEPLDDLMATEGFKADEWNPAALKALQKDGKQYAMPYGLSTMALYYNKDLFKQAGVEDPAIGWSISDFEAAAKKITEATGKPAFGQSFSDLHMFSQLLAYNGARPVADDGKLDLTNPTMEKAFSWYSGLATDQKVALVPASSSDVAWGEQQFVAGNTAMAVDGTWNVSSSVTDAKFAVGVATVPVGPGGIMSYSANSGFGIAKSCAHKAEAAKAIAVITGAKGQDMTAEGGTLPARSASDDKFYAGLTKSASQEYSDQVRAVVEETSKTAIPFIPTGNWDAVTKSIAREFILSYTNSQSPADSLQKVQDSVGG